ncbi:MAG TPA: PTS sugar transporter subunit IIA [Polyangia bacterium]|jgi:PTS system nitrogen regulatory IIA component
MKIVDFVREDMVLPDLNATEKPALIEELAAHIARTEPGLDRAALVRVLSEREQLASTAIGEGVAIPHGKLESVAALVACIGRSRAGVDFDSLDGRPTHLFFVLIAPENSTGVHLKALARISRLFKDEAFRQRLLGAPDAAAMYRVVVEEDSKY